MPDERTSSITPSSRDNIEALLAEIAARDGALRAFITVTAHTARAAALASERRHGCGRSLGPLDGVAVALKDNIDLAGVRGTAGLALYRRRTAASDAFVTARLREAGALILGKLNMDEGALGATCDNPHYGRCQHPRRPGYTPGGSSGGSAAAVAAGFCRLALGTDTLGSVRIPAAYCGIYGLLPTAGLLGRSGVVPLCPSLDRVGLLAAGPDELVAGLQTLAGVDADDPGSRPPPPEWRAVYRPREDLHGVVFGVPDTLDGLALEPAVATAFRRALRHARRLGAGVRSVPANWRAGHLRRQALLVVESEAAGIFGEALRERPQDFSDGFRRMLEYGSRQPAARIAAARAELAAAGRVFQTVLRQVDALLLPTAPQTAFAHAAAAPDDQADLTTPASVAGLPALSLPLPADDDTALPTALQLVGRPFAESELLAWGAALSASGNAAAGAR